MQVALGMQLVMNASSVARVKCDSNATAFLYRQHVGEYVRSFVSNYESKNYLDRSKQNFDKSRVNM